MSHPTAPSPLTVLSRACPFVTLGASDLGGPAVRRRVVSGAFGLPDWLREWSRYLELGHSLVAVAMGRSRLGSTTKIRSIVAFAASAARPAFAHVYVEELEATGPAPREGAPLHVVRCAKLPRDVHFVELPRQKITTSPPLATKLHF
jgi:hypothetical protein